MRINYTPSSNSKLEYVKIKQCYLDIEKGIFTHREHYTSREKDDDTGLMIDKYRDFKVRAKVSMFSTSSIAYISSEDRWRIEIYFTGAAFSVWMDFEDKLTAAKLHDEIWGAVMDAQNQ